MSAPCINPWLQTGTGRAVDLIEPTPEMIDLNTDVAEALAREPRFGGHVRSGAYSVAQHCVLGVDLILRVSDDAALARAFLLHDAHEAFVKDETSPLHEAMAMRVERCARASDIKRGLGAALYKVARREIKEDFDRAIYAAAGLAWPPPPEIAREVQVWDLSLLRLERDQLLGKPPASWATAVETARPVRASGRITVWPWPKAADEWRARLHLLFPHLKPA
ncbi:hypothetical protein [Paracoccus sp. (in: a-proteobacteria)]|uniref:hypothetical protein n=1 Tax=Paracoccus sp. TaxID=267 RepID=UPI002AFE1595|nr:hypothetical protein [Paracoccus sp. (in: a-proteobacteria)]